jgi:hypothetical protein
MKKLFFGLMLATALVSTASAGQAIIGHFSRVYNKAHLAEHPDQMVMAVKLSITPEKPNNSIFNYIFSLQMTLRGRTKTLKTTGSCINEGEGVRCMVECDGGGFYLQPYPNHVMMFLERIRMVTCDVDVENVINSGEEVTGGKDDHQFRLDRQ